MSKKTKPNSRWNKGNQRYDERTRDALNENFGEQHGWWKAARVGKPVREQ